MAKVISLTIRNRAAAILFIGALLALGAVFFTVGIALLIGLGLAGGVIGAGITAYRALRGKPMGISSGGFQALGGQVSPRVSGLDPSLEIAPPRAAIVRPARENGLDDTSIDTKDS